MTTLLEMQPSFEYLCRVCAANTKGRNSVPECVSILKTPALREKIDKYLYLTISEEDILPKVLCKACFRQVEATASLSKIAKHTQRVFRDFLTNAIPRTPPTADLGVSEERAVTNTASDPDPDLIPPVVSDKESAPNSANSVESPPPLVAPAPSTASTSTSHDEVVVNVSVNDPLTRETQHKMIYASQKRKNSLDSRFTPKSIAQRAFTSTPKQQENITSAKKPSPPGVINFFHNRPQQVTFTSGGYVIGRVATHPPAPTATDMSASTLQQKRKNLKMALNNIKSANTRQVSLLKVSQKPSQQPVVEPAPAPQPEQKKLTNVNDETPVEELPERMIIAAAKHQKQRSTDTKSNTEPDMEPTDLSQQPRSSLPEDILLGKVIKDVDLLKLILKALKWPVTKQTMDVQMTRLKNSKFSQIMSDPNLLQDTDLTQIMGPYLAPVLHAAQVLQQQQQIAAAAAAALAQPLAAASKAAELQTAGLSTAIPYKLPAETSVQLVPASPEEENAAKSSSSAQSQKRDARNTQVKTPPRKVRKVQKVQRSSSIVISDDENGESTGDSNSVQRNTKSTPNFHVNIDPSSLFTQFGIFGGTTSSSSNDALVALLQRQRNALSRLQRSQRRKRSDPNIITVLASGSDLAFDEDDIVLMEPDQNEVGAVQVQESTTSATVSSSSASDTGFPVPQQVSKPLITRPIVKRRKTVIQASPACTNLAASVDKTKKPEYSAVVSSASMSKLTASTSSTNILPPMPPLQKKPSQTASSDSLNGIGTQYPSTIISIATQVPSNTVSGTVAVTTKATETVVTATASAATSVGSLVAGSCDTSPVRTYVKKQQTSKAALGQQLLEAIGLQKNKGESGGESVKAELNPRESVQQIRSALKKSLQEAQKQSQRKQEEPVKQDADSTTKNVVKEVVVEPKPRSRNADDIALDVEEEINKITLVLQSKMNDDKKHEEADKKLAEAAGSRIPGIRRKIVPPTRSGKLMTIVIDDEPDELKTIDELREASDTKTLSKANERSKEQSKENEGKASKIDKEEHDNRYLKASSMTSIHKAESVTSTEANTTPTRKRGRKPKSVERREEGGEEEFKKEDPTKESARTTTVTERTRVRTLAGARKPASEQRDFERDSDTASLKNESDAATTSASGRPTRVSKTMSKYYKGPNVVETTRRIPTRSTRNRN